MSFFASRLRGTAGIRRWSGVLIALAVAGCGHAQSFDPQAQPAKTMFAVAQIVEARVAASVGAYRDGGVLATACQPLGRLGWTCSSAYVPASGVVDSLGQIGAETFVSYDKSRRVFTFTGDGQRTGSRFTVTLPARTVESVVKLDGSRTSVSTNVWALQAPPGYGGAVSISTLPAAARLLARDHRDLLGLPSSS